MYDEPRQDIRGAAGQRQSGSAARLIDPYQATRFADLGLQFLADAGVAGLVEHHAGESQIVLPRLLAEAAGSTWPS